ncbi:alpha/beta hydrolase family protein [Pseudonocardia lacus]|uniref:alpha/beta hydrolase family protein n=1 Tax=Pseudonocardia lacus TaxID=2835865 RepID=UPI001BDCF157|nr:prolyl oligopeptidase family serine peptidase [Pseudonocardia lacus]
MHLPRRVPGAAWSLLLAIVVLLQVPASAAAAGPVPPDQPRPGYTIVPPDLDPLPVDGGDTQVITGVHRHAGFAIEVPPRWNGQLVMWAHGFRGNGAELTTDPPPDGLRQKWVEQGYAWAASSYDRNGYDVASGVASTRALVDRFAREVRRPDRVLIAGASMGGHVTVRAIEQDPRLYAGALPMCGVLGDHDLFDYLLDFALTAQALSGQGGNYPPGPDYAEAVLPRVYAGLGLQPGVPAADTPQAQQLVGATVISSGGPRPGAEASVLYWKDFLLGLAVPDDTPTPVTGVAASPGVVATNLGTDYAPDEPVDLDAAVQRVPVADPDARESRALTPVAQVLGRPKVPVLSLHGLGDLFVPFRMEQVYAAEVAGAGRSDELVQRAVRTTGHCEFAPAEVGAAWDDLVTWVDGGPRPAGDDVTDPAAVADPAFGCRFSDRAAYDAAGPPAEDDTRRLYAPCP